jgi:peptidoglycan/LPS O-acetylase OafA/YrhL
MIQRRYSFLDGIRGLAAIFVLTRHTGVFWHFSLYRSYLAVDLFFILSGFVIAFAYDARISNKMLSVPKFMIIRLVRLYPVFFLSVVLCSLKLINEAYAKDTLSGDHVVEISSAIFMTLLFLPFPMTGNVSLFPLNGAYWSLLFELLTNMLYALFRPLLSDLRLLMLVMFSGIGVVCVALAHGNLDAGFLWTLPHIVAGLLRSIFGISVGLLLYRRHDNCSESLRNISPWWTFPVVAIVLASPELSHMNWLADVLSVCVVFPLCVLVGSRNIATRFEAALLTLGSASYPIYVLHAPLGEIISNAWRGVGAFAPYSGVVFVLALIWASIVVENYYDIPVRRYLSGFLVNRASLGRK